ncbi:hypothetical protein AB4Z45_04845 [Paenibacillus sp. MCAF9]
MSFTIFNASELSFPEPLFDGPPERKTIKLKQGNTVDYDQLTSLVGQVASTL